jgi:hypothetical protein
VESGERASVFQVLLKLMLIYGREEPGDFHPINECRREGVVPGQVEGGP